MRLFMPFVGLLLLTACPKDGPPIDTGEPPDPDSPPTLSPLRAEILVSALWDDGREFEGYSVGVTLGGVITSDHPEERIARLAWDAGQLGVADDLPTVVTYPGGADAVSTFEDGAVNLAFGLMGGGIGGWFGGGVDPLTDATLADATFTIAGTEEASYTGKINRFDADGDGADDAIALEGTIPGKVRVFRGIDALRGALSVEAADITLTNVCADSTGYGPTFVERAGDVVIAGCAATNYSGGYAQIFAWPLTDGAEPIGEIENVGGWHGASHAGYTYLDRRGVGQLVIRHPDGDVTTAYPGDASTRFGAQPRIAEAEGRAYLIVGDQAWGEGTDTTGRVTVCDITDEPAPPDEGWWADCLHVPTPGEGDFEFLGAGVDCEPDGAGALYCATTGWPFGGGRASGVVGWHVYR